MKKNENVKIRVLTPQKKYARADNKDEAKVIEIVRTKILPKTNKDYSAVDVKIKRKKDNTPECLIAYLLREDVYFAEVVRVDLEKDYKVADTTWDYDSTQIDDDDDDDELLEEKRYVKYDFVVATPVDHIPTAKSAVEKLHTLFTHMGYKSKTLLGSEANLYNYKKYLKSGLKGFINIGHGNTRGIALHDGFLSNQWFQNLPAKALNPTVVYFNSCQVSNEPLKSSIMHAGAKTFIGGIVNLRIGPSEEVCVGFWTKCVKENKRTGMRINLKQAEKEKYIREGDHGFTGYAGPFISVTTRKEIRKDPIKDIRKEAIKDGIKDGRKDPIKDIRKEAIKDGIKDGRKDPIKDIRKDPPRDTRKEIRKDPINEHINIGHDIDIIGGHPHIFETAYPFITEAPSRYIDYENEMFDEQTELQITELEEYVSALEEELLELEQRKSELLTTYQETIATIESLKMGGEI